MLLFDFFFFFLIIGQEPLIASSVKQVELNARLCALADHIQDQPEVRIRYFVPDERKSGGAIVEICGTVKKLVVADGTIVLTDGTVIPISDIVELSDI